ncbi:hypothetical protein J2X21_005162 [Kinneretia asaccharophila]|uniref:ABM domain-containing protein n=1 Tax=Roseateles asaccharophilus TaxID=582607 RepID=A0ABU2AFZ2_9BURK|nr:hypothetical protein [Roseateles asaccharophilus]
MKLLLAEVDALPGCLSYVVAEDPADDVTVWVTEVWTDAAAHKASLQLPAVKAVIAQARSLRGRACRPRRGELRGQARRRRGVGSYPQRAGNAAWPRKSPRPFGLSLAGAHAALLVVAGTSPRPPRALLAPLPGSTRATRSAAQTPPLIAAFGDHRETRPIGGHGLAD